MINIKKIYRFILLAFVTVLLSIFYGCSTGRDGDRIIHEDIIIKNTTTSYATDKGTIVLVSNGDNKVIVEAKEEQTFPSGAAIVLVERALLANEIGSYGGDSTNVYILTGTYFENGIEKKLTETDKTVVLTIPNVFSSEYIEFILGYKPINANDWQYVKLGDNGKATVSSARCDLGSLDQFMVTTRHIGYCYTVFGVKPDTKKFDDVNSITFSAEPADYALNANNEYTKDFKISTLVEAEKTTSMFTASDLKSELTFYSSSSAKTGVLVDGIAASESVSLEKEFNGEYLHRISINQYSEANLIKNGNLATFSFTLGIKGISKNDFPSEFHVKSTITTDNLVVFAGEGKIALRAEGENPKGLPIDVVMSSPASNVAALISTPIVLRFSEAIEWTTKAKKLISISNELQANLDYSAVISDDFRTLTITPAKTLNYNSLYTIEIETGITAKGTNNYVKPVSFNFMTEAGSPVKAVIKPNIGSQIGNFYIRKPEFIIDFGRSAAEINTVKSSIIVLLGNQVVDYDITFTDDKNRIASLTFPTGLQAGESYSIKMTNSIKDNAGLDIGTFEPASLVVFPDVEVVETIPANNSENVIASSPINLRLSLPMLLETSIAKNYFSIKDTVSGAEFPFNCAYDEVNKVISLIPQGNLLFNRRYQVFVKDGLTDKKTLQRLGSYSFCFKTTDIDYVTAVLTPDGGYYQNNVFPYIVFRENPKMIVDFVKDLADYSQASAAISIWKNGVVDDWQKSWDGNRLMLMPPGNQMEKGAVYRITMSNGVPASDNSLVNPFAAQELTSTLVKGKGCDDNPFLIYTADDFEAMRLYRTSCFTVMDNIDFTDVTDFQPIGNELANFSGKLQGNGKIISNLTVLPAESVVNVGLLGTTYNAVIASLTLDETCKISGDENIGGIIGKASGGSITNCVNKAQVNGNRNIGGIAGLLSGVNVDACANAGHVIGAMRIGGIAGWALETDFNACKNDGHIAIADEIGCNEWVSAAGISGQAKQSKFVDCENNSEININAIEVAGIVADFESGEIINCKNSGAITAYYYAAGIAGYVMGNISKCTNAGNISATCSDYEVLAAGIVGSISGGYIEKCCNKGSVCAATNGSKVGGIAADATEIIDCCNEGDISGYEFVGGIAAAAYSINNSCNKGKVTGYEHVGGIVARISYGSGSSIVNCLNDAEVTGSYDGEGVGGILGYSYNTENTVIENCCNKKDIAGGNKVGGIWGESLDDGKIVIRNSYNVAKVSGKYSVGGIFAYAGRADEVTIQNCYDRSDLSGVERVGGIVGDGDNIKISNCYYEGELIRTSGTQSTFAAIVNFPSFFSGTTELYNCFSTTNSVIAGSGLTVSGSLKTPDYVGTDENNYVFDASQLAANGYDTVIKGAAWGEGSTWNNEDIWNFYSDKLPELKNMPEP